jgi:hypothetical protein
MNWKEAETLIRQTIINGMKLDSRTVLEGPDFPCWGYDYNGTPGFKIRIGPTTCIEIPFVMLQTVYTDAIANNRTYENKVFKNKYERQLKSHGCHVHIVGKIFEKAGIATQIDNRKYKVL